MKVRIAFRRGEPVVRQHEVVAQIDGRVGAVAGRIDVDDLDVFADRSGLEIAVPTHVDKHFADIVVFQLGTQARIEGEDAQTPLGRRRKRLGKHRFRGRWRRHGSLNLEMGRPGDSLACH